MAISAVAEFTGSRVLRSLCVTGEMRLRYGWDNSRYVSQFMDAAFIIVDQSSNDQSSNDISSSSGFFSS